MKALFVLGTRSTVSTFLSCSNTSQVQQSLRKMDHMALQSNCSLKNQFSTMVLGQVISKNGARELKDW